MVLTMGSTLQLAELSSMFLEPYSDGGDVTPSIFQCLVGTSLGFKLFRFAHKVFLPLLFMGSPRETR